MLCVCYIYDMYDISNKYYVYDKNYVILYIHIERKNKAYR